MSGSGDRHGALSAEGRRAQRRNATASEIVAAAWEVVGEEGLSGLTMRDLGARVGMRAQSLYSYFPSKHAIYDAMFAQGYQALLDTIAGSALHELADPVGAAKAAAHTFFQFCVSDPVRFQLLFLRTIPGFEPSPASYALATTVLDRLVERLAELGVVDPAAVDLWTAVLTGLASQQIANDPGGTRWQRLVDDAVEMLLAHSPTPTKPARQARTR